MSFRQITLRLPKEEHNKFVNKCDFFDVCPKDVMTEFIIKFNKGELDDIFNVPNLPEINGQLPKALREAINGLR